MANPTVGTLVAALVGFIAYIPLAYIVGVAERFSSLSFASFVVPAFPFWVVIVSYALLGYWIYRLWYHKDIVKEDELLKGWTIVEEETIMGDVSKDTSPITKPPIFFR